MSHWVEEYINHYVETSINDHVEAYINPLRASSHIKKMHQGIRKCNLLSWVKDDLGWRFHSIRYIVINWTSKVIFCHCFKCHWHTWSWIASGIKVTIMFIPVHPSFLCDWWVSDILLGWGLLSQLKMRIWSPHLLFKLWGLKNSCIDGHWGIANKRLRTMK